MNLWQIAISETNAGDFSQTTTCGGTLGAGADCTASITFQPTATGARTASLLFSGDGGGSPPDCQVEGNRELKELYPLMRCYRSEDGFIFSTLTLSGAGVDFSMSDTASSAATISAGETATYISVAPATGYTQTVSFSCSGAPTAATCALQPATFTFTNEETVMVSMPTTARSSWLPVLRFPLMLPWPLATVLVPFALLMIWRFARHRQDGHRALWPQSEPAALFLFFAILSTSCGGCKSPSSSQMEMETPAGTYTISVTGTAGASSHTIMLTLTVQ